MLASIQARHADLAVSVQEHNSELKKQHERINAEKLHKKRERKEQGRPQNRLLQFSRFKGSQKKVRKVIHETASRPPASFATAPTQNPVLDPQAEEELAQMADQVPSEDQQSWLFDDTQSHTTDYDKYMEAKKEKAEFRHLCNELFGDSLESKFKSVT